MAFRAAAGRTVTVGLALPAARCPTAVAQQVAGSCRKMTVAEGSQSTGKYKAFETKLNPLLPRRGRWVLSMREH